MAATNLPLGRRKLCAYPFLEQMGLGAGCVRGHTRQEVADFLELARTTATALEKGEGRIRPDELISLGRAVRTPGQHFCRVQGFALREIARRFGVSRNTVRQYVRGLTQPTNRPHNHGSRSLSQFITKRSDWHFRRPFLLTESLDKGSGAG